MSFDYLNEAFKKLSLLKEETFDTSPNGLANMKSFMDVDLEDDKVRIIDPEADRDEDLQNSYIGKVITNCNVCHSNIFENKEDIVIDEDGSVNAEKQCPYCGETMGFTVIGEVTEFVASNEDNDIKVEVDGEPVAVDNPVEEPAAEEKLEEELQPTHNKQDEVELEEGKREYKPHTLKILKMLDEEPLTEGNILTEVKKIKSGEEQYRMVKAKDLKKGDVVSDSAGHADHILRTVLDTKMSGEQFCIRYKGNGAYFTCDPEKEFKVYDAVNTAARRDYDRSVKRASKADETLPNFETSVPGKLVTEAVNNVNVETDDSIVSVQSDNDGKVTVSTEPKKLETTGEEAIGPVSDDTLAEIEAENALEVEEEPVVEEDTPVEEEEYDDIDFEEVDEESFDELGESYLKRVYENVESFRTCDVSSDDSKLIVEGVIKFKSGAEKKTGFIFEAHSTADGKVRFTGMNEHFSRGSKSFALTGKVENKKLISESLTYNYRAKVGNGKSTRIYGTICK